MNEKELLALAKKAREQAYAPYSGFMVGAALLCADGSIYTGCNVENASYGAAICAERNAVSTAVAAGKRDFEAIAIAAKGKGCVYPCGICLQVMNEFSKDMKVICQDRDNYQVFRLKELLPKGFDEL
ncbi:cytidine deaminase [Anaerostipes sp.]|uniref:cytidine deaminase n=1 Tax=Anaerostipes sp. TaxID=1872530 RepID=UPI0025B87B5B|nr:cytidine deaminase [Anaerostipes sp.]MBS7008197.1 cytidine deaminase [Anaerostipes sp.]